MTITFIATIPLFVFVIALLINEKKKEREKLTTKPTEETIARAKAKLSEAFGERPPTTTSLQYQSTLTRREALTRLTNSDTTEELATWAREELAKLDQECYSKNIVSIRQENQPIANAIVVILSQGKMLVTDLAVLIGESVRKTSAMALTMEKLGILTKSTVYVEGKGQVSCYELRAD
jgi:hypothetical protein